MKKIIYLLVLFSLFFLLTTKASFALNEAEYMDRETRISMDVSFGFDNTIKKGGYNHAVFFIKNDGKSFKGKLSVKVGSGYSNSDNALTTTQQIYLPELSRKRIYIYFYCPPRISSGAAITFELTSEKDALIFSTNMVAEKGLNIVSSEKQYGRISGFLTVVISDKNFGYDFLTGTNTGSSTPAARRTGNYVQIRDHNLKYPTYESLPDDSLGYDGVNLILMTSMTVANLSSEQRKAIFRYVNEGGNILFTKSENDLWLKDDFIKKLLPGEIADIPTTLGVIGTYNQTTTRSRSYSSSSWTSMREVNAYDVLEVTASDEKNIFAAFNTVPVILKKNIGGGMVFLTAFDPSQPPFAGSRERQNLFENIFSSFNYDINNVDRRGDSNFSVVGIFNNLVNSLMSRGVVKKAAAFFTITFLVYIILLGPINYLVLKRMKRLEFAWLSIPLISLAFSTIFFVSGYAIRGAKNHLFTFSIVRVYDKNNFHINSFLSTYVSEAGRYDLDIERQNIVIKSYTVQGSNQESSKEIEIAETIRVKDIDIKKWSEKNFTLSGYICENSDYKVSATKLNNNTFEIDYDFPFAIGRLFYVDGSQVYNMKIDEKSKKGKLKLTKASDSYYKSLIDFAARDMLDFNSSSRDSRQKRYRGNNLDILGYIRSKHFIKDGDDYFIALTSDELYSYELKDTKSTNKNQSIIIIPVDSND